MFGSGVEVGKYPTYISIVLLRMKKGTRILPSVISVPRFLAGSPSVDWNCSKVSSAAARLSNGMLSVSNPGRPVVDTVSVGLVLSLGMLSIEDSRFLITSSRYPCFALMKFLTIILGGLDPT